MTVHVHTLGAGKQRIVEEVRDRRLEGMLLCSPEHVYYTTGLPAVPGSGNPILFALRNQLPSFAYVGANGTITLLCWIGATLGFSFDVDEVRSFFSASSALDELRDFLKAALQPGAKIGVESTCPWNVIALLQEVAPSIAISAVDELLLGLRMVKTADELERIRKATKIVEATVADLRNVVRPGISRLWLIDEAKRLMLAHGASGIGHTTIAFGSSNAEIAFDETLAAHQLVTLDLGAVVDGYTSDNRRLLFTGSIPGELRALHRSMCEIVTRLGEALQPGVAFADLYALATELYEARGLPPLFINVGHSIGLQTEEAWISFDSPYVVQTGMVLNIEMYSPYVDGSMIGDEETFLVTKTAATRLTQSSPEMLSI